MYANTVTDSGKREVCSQSKVFNTDMYVEQVFLCSFVVIFPGYVTLMDEEVTVK
jgi:hypothetical protein